MIRARDLLISLSLAVVFAVSALATVAAQSSSAHYEVNQVFFGSGGSLDSSSPDYQSQQALGELTIGNTSSTNYQAYGGYNTTDIPLLELSVTGGDFNLGNLTNSATSSISTTFSVRNYLSHGYVVDVVGTSLTSAGGTHTVTPITSLGCSVPGQEQFGINLTNNTTGTLNGCTAVNVGAVPQQYPSSAFSYGAVASNYDYSNKFLFHSGDEVAYSNKSSGETIYTLSAIANISSITPAHAYTADLSLIAIPTF